MSVYRSLTLILQYEVLAMLLPLGLLHPPSTASNTTCPPRCFYRERSKAMTLSLGTQVDIDMEESSHVCTVKDGADSRGVADVAERLQLSCV